MELSVFELIGGFIQPIMISKVAEITGRLSGWISVILLSTTTIWLMIMGIATMRGEVQSPFMTVVWKATKMQLFFFMGLSGFYMGEIVTMIYSLASELMGVFAASTGSECSSSFGGDPMGVYRALDCSLINTVKAIGNYFIAAFEITHSYWQIVASVQTAAQTIVLGIIMIIAASILYTIIGLEFMVTQISLILILCLGPMAFACLAFEPTKKYFDGWLGIVIYSVILQAMLVMYIGIAITMITQFNMLVHGDSSSAIEQIIQSPTRVIAVLAGSLILYTLLGFVATKIPGLVSAIVGASSQDAGSGHSAAQTVKNVSKTAVSMTVARAFIKKAGK